MTDIKKYITTINVFIFILITGILATNLVLSKYLNILSLMLNTIATLIILSIIFSTRITYLINKDKIVNVTFMKINFNIVSFLYPIICKVAKFIGISKDEIRKIYIKLNNSYIYNNKYNINSEDIIILIPHCIQNHNCKLKVTSDIDNCKECGKCKVKDLLGIKNKYHTKIFVATGGTLARKIIMDNKPKAVIAVACERDLTSGVRDVNKIPILGVFNERPNGPCVDTNIDIKNVENAIKFFTGNKESVLNVSRNVLWL